MVNADGSYAPGSARPAAGRVRKPMSEWLHLQQDVYPAYISWEQYLINQERIQQNGLRFVENRQKAQGVVRNGSGLLQGMVVCGRCGHHLQVVYKHTPRYVCRGLVRTMDVPSRCTSIRAPAIDQVVVEAFFEAIQPAQSMLWKPSWRRNELSVSSWHVIGKSNSSVHNTQLNWRNVNMMPSILKIAWSPLNWSAVGRQNCGNSARWKRIIVISNKRLRLMRCRHSYVIFSETSARDCLSYGQNCPMRRKRSCCGV